MKKYLVLYMAPVSAEEQMQGAGTDDGQKVMDMWMAWMGKAGAAIVDGGTPLGHGMNFTPTSSAKVQAPYVAGYAIMQADNMDSLKDTLTGHPHYMLPGGSIQVLEMMPISM